MKPRVMHTQCAADVPTLDDDGRRRLRVEYTAETPDRYDRGIAYLTARPWHIEDAWSLNMPGDTEKEIARDCEALFAYAGPAGRGCGCLTQIRSGVRPVDRAATPELTALIRADERIPLDSAGIGVECLVVFAEWQRVIDDAGVR